MIDSDEDDAELDIAAAKESINVPTGPRYTFDPAQSAPVVLPFGGGWGDGDTGVPPDLYES